MATPENTVESDEYFEEKTEEKAFEIPKKIPVKERLQDLFENAIAKSSTVKDLAKHFESDDSCEVYERNDVPVGVIVDDKKYRFTTLANSDDALEKTKSLLKKAREGRDEKQQGNSIVSRMKKILRAKKSRSKDRFRGR